MCPCFLDVFVRHSLVNSVLRVDPTGLSFVQMSPVFDADSSIDIDDAFASKRDDVTGIMGWTQFSYLMEHQIEGGPAYYARGEEEW